jgi:hypothetical protein
MYDNTITEEKAKHALMRMDNNKLPKPSLLFKQKGYRHIGSNQLGGL